MTERKGLRCPECGAEMNFHAEKVDTSRGFGDPATDSELGGLLVEFHTCPACGYIQERTAL